jgi:hypothetical protein
MPIFEHILFITLIIVLLIFTYQSLFKDLGKKEFLLVRMFPFISFFALKNMRSYVIYHKVGMVVVTLMAVALYVTAIIKFG